MKSLISIIVPCYNQAQYLDECLQSVYEQSFTDWECIVVNDGSTDNTNEIASEWVKKDVRFRYLEQENKGVSAARNAGIMIAKGEYLGFIDCDDSVEIKYLEELYNLINQSFVGLAICGFKGSSKRFLDDGVIFLSKSNEDNILNLFKSYLIFGPYNKLYKKYIIRENKILFNQKFEYGEDLLFNLKYLHCIEKVQVTSKVLYNYRIHLSNSLSKKYKLKRFSDVEYQIKKIEIFLNSINIHSNNSIRYILELYYWNTYNCIYELYKNIGLTSKIEAIKWIQEIFNFYYPNSKNKYKDEIKLTILMKILFYKKKWLVFYYLLLIRSFKGLNQFR